jgi:hypothetical protein
MKDKNHNVKFQVSIKNNKTHYLDIFVIVHSVDTNSE